ncbi:hypothetical protein I010019E5_09680 [Bifidobacterium adolescentis]
MAPRGIDREQRKERREKNNHKEPKKNPHCPNERVLFSVDNNFEKHGDKKPGVQQRNQQCTDEDRKK